MSDRLWNANTKKLIPYVPGEQPRTKCIKLNTNENPYPPSPNVKDLLSDFKYDSLRLYPDPTSSNLKEGLAEYYGVEKDEIFIGNGSDEVLAFAFQAFFDKEMPVAFPDITYSFYPVYANLYSIPTEIIPLDENFNMPLKAIKVFKGGVVLANPNAPTGMAEPLSAIIDLLKSNPDRLVIIDEAYIDFGGETATGLVRNYENLLVVQTVSKSRSLAGLRVGYAFGNPSLIKALECIRDSFNSYTIDTLAQKVALVAIKDGTWFEQTRAKIIKTREWFIAALSELGFTTLPSKANFIFTKPSKSCASELYELLKEKGILIRYFRKPRIDSYLRISIGTDEEMEQLLIAFEEILNQN